MASYLSWINILCISFGASIGACLRFIFTEYFSKFNLPFSLGTLLVNGVGGLIVGGLYGYFFNQTDLSPVWRLALITGLCGGFTTFSAFSLEVFLLLQSQRYLMAIALALAHVFLAVIMTAIGWYLISKVQA